MSYGTLLSVYLVEFVRHFKLSFEILKCKRGAHAVSESGDQEQHPLLLWLETERDRGCCQGHSSAFAQPWLSKAERAQALETPSG